MKFFDTEAKNKMIQDYAAADKRLLLLDYDGTLVPFSSVPALAEPSAALKDLLTALAKDERNTVYIISGRDSQTLERWLGHLPINMISEHGAKFKFKGGAWENVITANANWKKYIKPILETYVKRCAHTFIEMKDYSMAWHYRNANPEQAKIRAAELHAELSEHTHNHDLHILNGNKVIEVRNSGIDKGTAIQRVLSKGDYDFILSFGDDRTDEDMFRILADHPRAYTVKVGSDASFAKYNLHTSYMVISMLETITNAGVMTPGISQN